MHPQTLAAWEKLKTLKANHLSNHESYLDRPLSNRLVPAPRWLLDLWRKADKRADYAPATPTPFHHHALGRVFSQLPPVWQKEINKNLVAIYLVRHLWGGGITDHLPNPDGTVKSTMILNEACFHAPLSEWVTEKDLSAFTWENPSIALEWSFGAGPFTGLDYVFTHEAAHVVDFATWKTPGAEGLLSQLFPQHPMGSRFSEGVWTTENTPVKSFDYPQRAKVRLYGFGGEPQLKLTEAESLYRALSKTPFVSLYGSKTQGEDFADYGAFQILAKVSGMSPTLTVRKEGVVLFTYKPLETDGVRTRHTANLGLDP